MTDVAFDDIQGLLRWGHRRHTEAVFLLMAIRDSGAARAWLARAPVSTAVAGESTTTALQLQVAFTHDGLRALGVAAEVTGALSPEFLTGMHGLRSRSARLGDVGPTDPSRWAWGSGLRMPHVAILLYALPGGLAAARRALEAELAPAFTPVTALETRPLGDFEPFGFRDGLSQPTLDWDGRRPVEDATLEQYTNLSCLGEFLLGYPNEYGGYTDRPLLDPARDGASALPRALDAPDRADFGRNGSYLVLRQLDQDVAGFRRSLAAHAGDDAPARVRLAEAMVGRRISGDPLMDRSVTPIDGITDAPNTPSNAFTYRADPDGLRCPLGAHVRRANPRTADLPPGAPGVLSRLARTLGFDTTATLHQDLVASARFHRLLRRGRAYGPPLRVDDAPDATADSSPQGLHFIALNASIARQFEFVQGAWIAGTRFAGLPGEADPLLGNRVPGLDGRPTDSFSMPRGDGPDSCVAALPRFVTVRGGAYFFLPGLRALRWIAGIR